MGQLVVSVNQQVLQRIDLTRQVYVIGRHADCDIVLPDRMVSAQHARLVSVDDDCFLEDMDSTNGTFIHEQPVSRHLLADHDTVVLGKYRLMYLSKPDLPEDAEFAWLEIVTGQKQGMRIPLTKDYMTLGGQGVSQVAVERNQQGEYLLHSVVDGRVRKLVVGDDFDVCDITLRLHSAPSNDLPLLKKGK